MKSRQRAVVQIQIRSGGSFAASRDDRAEAIALRSGIILSRGWRGYTSSLMPRMSQAVPNLIRLCRRNDLALIRLDQPGLSQLVSELLNLIDQIDGPCGRED